MKITPEQAREALDAWICRPGMTQEQATILITEAFWALKERPNIDVQRVTDEGGAVDQRALGVNRVKIFERWKAIDTRDKREKFTALVPAIMEAMTNFYTINYGSELLDGGKLSESIGSKCAAPSGQNDTMEEVKMKRSIGSKRPNVIGSKWPDDLTENTTEITTENKNTFRPEASQPDPQTTEQDFLTRNSDAVVFSAKKRQWGSREDLACAQWIWGRIVGLYEQAASDDGEIMRPKEPNWTAWANDVRTMRMLDGRSHRQICEMFGRVQRDPFWVKNIMSPSKLREKWDELVIRLGRSPVQRCVNHISEPDTEIPPGFRG